MLSGRTIRLGQVFGIRIGADVSWFIVLFLVIWQYSQSYQDPSGNSPGFSQNTAFVMAVAAALLLFLSIILHELGHALEARREGVGIERIDLWMFGGLAQLKRDARTPGEEFRIAIAGPAVTLVIAAVCLAATGFDAFKDTPATATGTEVHTVISDLGAMNLLLLVFNLLPAFPLDGGRLVRAIAWKVSGNRRKGTRFAAALGTGMGWLMVAGGVALVVLTGAFGGIWLAFIGWFITQAARSTVIQSDATAAIEGMQVADVMDAEPVSVRNDARLDSALDDYFIRYGWAWFPVVDHLGRFVGLLTRENVERVPEALRPTSTVDEVMARDPKGALKVRTDEPLESLLSSDAIGAVGAMMAVDDHDVLKGVVTVDQLRRALQPPAPAV